MSSSDNIKNNLGVNVPPRKREKVALAPGFGLRHWSLQAMKLPSVAANKSIQISITEVRKHNSREDAWVVLRGLVYDITKFLDHHPGGVTILEQVFGEDCTELFDDYHAFVNSDFILEK